MSKIKNINLRLETSVINLYIGERVLHYREFKNLTQEKLAEDVGLTGASIANIESGKSGASLDKLYRITDILGVSIFDVLPDDTFVKNYRGKKVVRKVIYEVIDNDSSVNSDPYSSTACWVGSK